MSNPRRRIYISKEPDEFEAIDVCEKIFDRIPSAPPGQLCECDSSSRSEARRESGDLPCHPTETPAGGVPIVQITSEHPCYIYVCTPCADHWDAGLDETIAEGGYPTGGDGYAFIPSRCEP